MQVRGDEPGAEPGTDRDQHEETDHRPGEEGAGLHQDHSGTGMHKDHSGTVLTLNTWPHTVHQDHSISILYRWFCKWFVMVVCTVQEADSIMARVEYSYQEQVTQLQQEKHDLKVNKRQQQQ